MDDSAMKKEKKVYVSLYKKDSLSYTLALCAIVTELVYVISILDVMPISFWMGMTVMLNIGVLFALFTCAVKMNVYDERWAVIAVGLGVYMLIRQFVLVPGILKPYDRLSIIAAANVAGAVLLFGAGIVSRQRCSKRSQLQKKLAEGQDGGV